MFKYLKLIEIYKAGHKKSNTLLKL